MHRSTFPIAAVCGLAAVGLAAVRAVPAAETAKEKKPQIEVVFVLDTTGSMGGLIEGAKKKIWSMANQMVSGKPTPEVKVGLVAYRDRGDAYVTRLTPLTLDLDDIYAKLTEFKADGGGDGPESVNQALHEAVTKFEWSKDSDTLKIVYLVGDAPPHMDYKEDVPYSETCQLAVKNNILINTVQCGGLAETRTVWEKIAKSSEGQFVAIPQDGGTVAVATPYDADLTRFSTLLGSQTLVYGTIAKQEADKRKLSVNVTQSAEGAAARGAFQARTGRVADYDFLDAVNEKRVDLKTIKEEELPESFRKLSPKDREAKVAALTAERKQLLAQIAEVSKKRDAYIAEQQKKTSTGKDGFDQQVLLQLRSQAARHGIKY